MLQPYDHYTPASLMLVRKPGKNIDAAIMDEIA